MNQVSIYFSDLTAEAQARVMEGMGISAPNEGNFEIAPLAILDFEEQLEDCEICGGLHPAGFEGDCRDNGNRRIAKDSTCDELIGYYNLDGYRIENSRDGEVIYVAGNSPHDSTATVDRAEGLPLTTLKTYCERIGQELSEERGATFAGAFTAADEDCGREPDDCQACGGCTENPEPIIF